MRSLITRLAGRRASEMERPAGDNTERPAASGLRTLATDEIAKAYGGRQVVRGVSMSISQGEVVGLLGPNGAGKTTTIRMMVGLMSMTAGEIRIAGHSVRTEFEQAIRHVGANWYHAIIAAKSPKQIARSISATTIVAVGITSRGK